MKILLLAEACGAGVGRHVIDLARSLAAGRHEVHLVYSSLRVDRAFMRGFNALCADYPGFHSMSIPMRRHPDFSDLSAVWKLRRYASEHGPFDAIHAHSTKAGLLARVGCVGLPGLRIYTPHAPLTLNPEIKPWALRLLRFYELSLARFTQYIIAVSPEEFSHLQRLGIPSAKLRLVPNGIDAEHYRPPVERAAGAPLCIGFLGRLAPQKDVPMLLAAFAQVLQCVAVPVELVICGDGPIRPELEQMASELGLGGRVRWLGECDSGVLESFDLLALSSRYEGLPYVVLEAMAAGLPAVCTRTGGISLLLAEGVTGFTAPVGDAAAFADGLCRLAEDSELRCRMGAAARNRVNHFSLHRMVRSTVGVYRGESAGTAGAATYAFRENSWESVH